MAIASQIPCVNKCTCCCRCCPFMEDKSEHFWMGVPGATLRLILGNQRTYGAVMNGRLIWYCGTEDALTKVRLPACLSQALLLSVLRCAWNLKEQNATGQ